MSESIFAIGKSIKSLLRKSFNCANLFRVFTFVFFMWLILECFFEIIEMQYHYYANITTSLEVISGKKLDRYDGNELKPKTTEDALIRDIYKSNHLRLRYLREGYRHVVH